MHKVIYSKNAVEDLRKLERVLAKRIVKKIAFFAKQETPLDFAKILNGFEGKKYRFRIGNYRAIFKLDKKGKLEILLILNIKHRKEVYL